MDFSLFWQWKHALFVVEALLVVVVSSFSFRLPALEKRFRALARHRFAPVAAGLFAIAIRAAILPIFPVPQPTVHDEFSYLLSADTFAHGRLANLTHPLWQHFETFHVDQFPTYGSMYPPLPGLVMGVGKAITGTPFAGVLFAVGLMCGVLCWALRGWFPPEWALFGALIAAVRIAMFSYWGDSYWGGALTATGGALLVGALPRLLRHSRPRDAALAALGVVMLVNTRPYDGTMFAFAVGMVALWQLRKLKLRMILLPLGVVLLCGGALTAYYNWRAFGSPTALPYTVNRAAYAVAPVFLFQSLSAPPVYRHATLRDFYTIWEVSRFEAARSLKGYAQLSIEKVEAAWSFYIGPVLTIPLLASLWTWRSRRTRTFLFLVGMVVLACLPVAYFGPHYVAAVTAVVYGLVVQGLRSLRRTLPGVVRAVPLIIVSMALLRLGLAAAYIPMNASMPMTWARISGTPMDREAIEKDLAAKGGQHLVIVHYGAGRNGFCEYVYNDADIDASAIVWAQDMGPEKNAELLQYYSSRKVWQLDVTADAVLSPYPGR